MQSCQAFFFLAASNLLHFFGFAEPMQKSMAVMHAPACRVLNQMAAVCLSNTCRVLVKHLSCAGQIPAVYSSNICRVLTKWLPRGGQMPAVY